MAAEPHRPRPTIIPLHEIDEDAPSQDAAPARRQPTAPSRRPSGERSAARRDPGARYRGFLGFGRVADVIFGVILSLVFAAGLGIGAALVLP